MTRKIRSRNYNLGSSNMYRAGLTALQLQYKTRAFGSGSIEKYRPAWREFVELVRTEYEVRRMEQITRQMLRKYGERLAEKVLERDMTPGTAQGKLTAINSIMRFATKGAWRTVSATKDCGIPKRSQVRTTPPISDEQYQRALELSADNPRAQALIRVAREFGCRSEEAAKQNWKSVLHTAEKTGVIELTLGTKGGQKRSFDLAHLIRQFDALTFAANVQGDDKSLIPADMTYLEFRDSYMREARDIVKEAGGSGLHDLRAAYACERYHDLTGYDAPCISGHREAEREIDHEARMTISEELGHHRIDVLASYVGSSK